MRSTWTAAKLISVWLLFILMIGSSADAQSNADGISISLSVTSTEFVEGAKPRALVTVTNRTGSPISLKSFTRIGLELRLKDRQVEFCRIDECFGSVVFPKKGELANDASVTFIAKLDDLYWHNQLSSIEPADLPKNLYTGLPSGPYELFAVLSVSADNPKSDNPPSFTIKSNTVSPVTITPKK